MEAVEGFEGGFGSGDGDLLELMLKVYIYLRF